MTFSFDRFGRRRRLPTAPRQAATSAPPSTVPPSSAPPPVKKPPPGQTKPPKPKQNLNAGSLSSLGLIVPGGFRVRVQQLGAAATGASYSAVVLADSPLLYLRLDETSGAACANSGSLGGSATATAGAGSFTRNVASHAGLGVAVTLTQSADDVYIAYPDNAALDLIGDFTYELWAKTGTSGTYYLISKGRDSSSIAGYAVTMTADSLSIRASGSNQLSSAAGAFPLDSNWHHVIATRSSNTWTLYVDSVSVATTSSPTVTQATTKPLLVGIQQTEVGFQNGFIGSVDEVAVYGTALSQARVTAHYNAAH